VRTKLAAQVQAEQREAKAFAPVDDSALFTESRHRRDGPAARVPTAGRALHISAGVYNGDGKLWVAALREGVFRYDGKQKTNYPVKDGDTAVEVFAVYKDNRGDLWLGTNNGGVYKFNGKAFEKWRP
jgi:ligand-binding sensor domain-containing protein